MRYATTLVTVLSGASACSNFQLRDDAFARISGRTMDLGYWDDFSLEAVPQGHTYHLNASGPAPVKAKFGYLSVFPSLPSGSAVGPERMVVAGLNTEGLSCDMQTLIDSQYPRFPADGKSQAVDVLVLCEWALASFPSTEDVAAALLPGNDPEGGAPAFVAVGPNAIGFHFILRDSSGSAVVLEFIGGKTHVHLDSGYYSDSATDSGVGIFTNEPPFPWHVANAKHLDWKQSLARPAVAVPGGFYPDERFLRLHLLRGGLPAPSSYEGKVQQALHLLDSVTVPPGKQPGTDSGQGEGMGDHTVFSLVYDHSPGNSTLYWRSASDHSLQRAQLKDLGVVASTGGPNSTTTRRLPISNSLPWFTDASGDFSVYSH